MVEKKSENHVSRRSTAEGQNLPGRRGVVRVGKVVDPGDHLRRSEAGARALDMKTSQKTRGQERIRAGTFEVDGSGERDPVARPSASVGEEVVSLRRAAGGIRVRKVVRAAYDTVVSRADVVLAEVGVDVRCFAASVNTNAPLPLRGGKKTGMLNLCPRSP